MFLLINSIEMRANRLLILSASSDYWLRIIMLLMTRKSILYLANIQITNGIAIISHLIFLIFIGFFLCIIKIFP